MNRHPAARRDRGKADVEPTAPRPTNGGVMPDLLIDGAGNFIVDENGNFILAV